MTIPIVTELDNGLRVLLLEDHTAPVATFWIWYGVGSRHEVPGWTGISHWVEHMQFKGTPAHPKATLTRAIERLGGRWNAFTSWDYTAYHEVLPAEHLPFVIDLEADRMRHTRFDPADVESERTVVIAEREGAENHPTSYLHEEVSALAFKVHSYRYPVIGWKSDLQRISRDDLYRHYRTYYHPGNALVVAVGAFETPRALEHIRRAFDEIDPGPPLPAVLLEEPPQEGERRVVVRRAGGATPYVQLAYRVPAATDADFPAVMVLDGILSGLGSRGNGGAARSSRLYRALVDRGLAVETSSSFFPTRDPGLLRVGATVRSGVPVAAVEEAILEQLRRLTTEEVPGDELARVRRQAKAQFVYARDGVHGFGYAIGLYAMTDRPDAFFTLQTRLEQVGAADVQRVAAAAFAPERRTVGWYVPREGAQTAATMAAAAPHRFSRQPASPTAPAPVVGPNEIDRRVLPNGLRVLTVDRPGSGMVALHVLIAAGSAFDGGRAGLARFVAAVQPRGTGTYSARDLAERLDGLGASLGIFPGAEVMAVAGRALAEDVAAYVALVGEVLVRPTFPPDEVEKVRGELLTTLRVSGVDTRYVAERAFRRLAFPPGHPHAQPPAGEEEALGAIDTAVLAAFHRRYVSPERTILVLVGDVRSAAAAEAVEQALGGWSRGPGTAAVTVPQPAAPTDGPTDGQIRRESVALPGKSQADIILGGVAVARQDPAYYQVALANYILGGQGMMGRVGERVREQMGLAYYAYLEARAGLLAGPWWARAGVHPASVERAVGAILEEITRFQHEGPTVAEVADARDFLTGSLAVRLETHGGLAGSLAEMELYELGLDYLVRYPGIIRAVSPEEMQAAAQRFPTNRHILTIAGPESS